MEKGEIFATPVDAQKVIERVGFDNGRVGEHSLEVGVKILQSWVGGETESKVEEVSGQEMVKLLKLLPGSVDKPILQLKLCLMVCSQGQYLC